MLGKVNRRKGILLRPLGKNGDTSVIIYCWLSSSKENFRPLENLKGGGIKVCPSTSRENLCSNLDALLVIFFITNICDDVGRCVVREWYACQLARYLQSE